MCYSPEHEKAAKQICLEPSGLLYICFSVDLTTELPWPSCVQHPTKTEEEGKLGTEEEP